MKILKSNFYEEISIIAKNVKYLCIDKKTL